MNLALMASAQVQAALDEALSTATIVVEGRRNAFIRLSCEGAKTKAVEDVFSTDLVAFMEGLTQGLGATLHADLAPSQESLMKAFLLPSTTIVAVERASVKPFLNLSRSH